MLQYLISQNDARYRQIIISWLYCSDWDVVNELFLAPENDFSNTIYI